MSVFGETVRELRRQSNYSISQLAREIGCSNMYLLDVETGRRNPFSGDKVKILENLFSTKLTHLVDISQNSIRIKLNGLSLEDRKRAIDLKYELEGKL